MEHHLQMFFPTWRSPLTLSSTELGCLIGEPNVIGSESKEFQETLGTRWWGRYDHREWDFCDLFISKGAFNALHENLSNFLEDHDWTFDQLLAGLRLLRSMLWRLSHGWFR